MAGRPVDSGAWPVQDANITITEITINSRGLVIIFTAKIGRLNILDIKISRPVYPV